jgi:hypothetical protein
MWYALLLRVLIKTLHLLTTTRPVYYAPSKDALAENAMHIFTK